MDYIISIILGTVQALTEFLPVSSSGHLVILHQILKSELLNNLTFDVILHAGTLLAVIIYFWSDLVKLVKGFFMSLFKRELATDFHSKFVWLIIIGTLPAALIGFLFTDQIEQWFRSVVWVIIMLIVGGLFFILAERFSNKIRGLESMTIIDALVIGLAQVLAFIPGTSRAGITIAMGLTKNFDRLSAARYSFLLSIPVIFGANIRKISQLNLTDFSVNFVFVSILGAAVAALIGYLTIRFLLKFLSRHSLTNFAIYRFVLAAVLILILLI